jgi:hypothetical protein
MLSHQQRWKQFFAHDWMISYKRFDFRKHHRISEILIWPSELDLSPSWRLATRIYRPNWHHAPPQERTIVKAWSQQAEGLGGQAVRTVGLSSERWSSLCPRPSSASRSVGVAWTKRSSMDYGPVWTPCFVASRVAKMAGGPEQIALIHQYALFFIWQHITVPLFAPYFHKPSCHSHPPPPTTLTVCTDALTGDRQTLARKSSVILRSLDRNLIIL